MPRRASSEILNHLDNPSRLKEIVTRILDNKLSEALSKLEAQKHVDSLNKNIKHGQWELRTITVPGTSGVHYFAINTVTREKIELSDFDKVLGAE